MMNAKERTKMFERISNSQELNEKYDAKLAALQNAKEDTQFHFNKKKAATAEKKQVFKDKTEVLRNGFSNWSDIIPNISMKAVLMMWLSPT